MITVWMAVAMSKMELVIRLAVVGVATLTKMAETGSVSVLAIA